MRVEYAKRVNNNPFSMNFPFQRTMVKNIQSRVVEINVDPLPPAPSEMSFTGLVGEHSFKLTQRKARYLVNEAIELQLEITGGGALEAYSGPQVYSHPELEEFETSSDLRVLNTDQATKVYDYTYLARNALEIENREIPLGYFDPVTKSYREVKLAAQGIKILGGGIAQENSLNREKGSGESSGKESLKDGPSDIAGPIFVPKLFW